MTDTFVPPATTELVDAPGARVELTDELLAAYDIDWAIDGDLVARVQADDSIQTGQRLVDILELNAMDVTCTDATIAHAAAIAAVAVAMIATGERAYDAEDALTVTLLPGGGIVATVDIGRLAGLARTSRHAADHADAEVLDSLTGDGVINLGNLATRLAPDVARAVADAFVTIAAGGRP
jgi:hypothetical protein